MIVRRRSRIAGMLLLALVASVSARAADLPLPAAGAPVFLVIFDLRGIEPGEITSTTEGGGPLTFPISAIDDEAVQCAAIESVAPLKQLKGYVECAIGHRLSGTDFEDGDTDKNDSPTIGERERAAKAIATNLVELRKNASPRAISIRGSNIVAVGLQTAVLRTIDQVVTAKCVNPSTEQDQVSVATHEFMFGRKPQFAIAEATRRSQIETDFNVLLTLAGKFVASGAVPPAPAPPPPDPCKQRGAPTTTYRSKSRAAAWSSGHPIPLAVKRATVTLDATLSAVAPQLLAAKDADEADKIIKSADEFLRLDALHKQEAEDLKLFDTCPAVDPSRLDPLQQVVCTLDKNTTQTSSASLAAVEALSKMPTPRKATFLRWVVENKTGEAREKALVALGQVPPATPAPGAAAGKEIKQTAKFLSGPLEHLSISADVFTTRQTPFKKDDSGAVVIDGTPAVFYVSLNFLMGDLPSTERTFAQNIELKWLLQGSDSPFDSIGFGIGLRGSYAKRFGFDFDLLSPFVGWTWTAQQDSGQPRVLETRFGVGLNINKALEWVR